MLKEGVIINMIHLAHKGLIGLTAGSVNENTVAILHKPGTGIWTNLIHMPGTGIWANLIHIRKYMKIYGSSWST